MAFTPGVMGVYTRETGLTIKCTAKDTWFGLTVSSMREITPMIRNMVKVLSHGQTVINTLVSGRMVSSTDRAPFKKTGSQSSTFGPVAKESKKFLD